MRAVTALGVLVLAAGIAGCSTGGGPTDPVELGQEQWAACDHFPSVELVDISADGKVSVRDTQFAAPPGGFQRCMAHYAYRQVFQGRRPGRDLALFGYFSDQPLQSKRGMVVGFSGPPRKRDQTFAVGEDAYLILLVQHSPRHLDFTFTLRDEAGPVFTYENSTGPTKTTAGSMIVWQKIDLPFGANGEYTVQVDMNGYDLGSYRFTVTDQTG